MGFLLTLSGGAGLSPVTSAPSLQYPGKRMSFCRTFLLEHPNNVPSTLFSCISVAQTLLFITLLFPVAPAWVCTILIGAGSAAVNRAGQAQLHQPGTELGPGEAAGSEAEPGCARGGLGTLCYPLFSGSQNVPEALSGCGNELCTCFRRSQECIHWEVLRC